MKSLRLISILWLIGFICGITSCSEKYNHPELIYSQDLQKAINQVLLTYPDYDLGISAAVIVPGYRIWTGGSGYSHQSVPITNDMLFDVGSIEKNFEAALVLKLAEAGLLSLDDPLSKYLPSFPNVDENISIRQLLNHTSGVFNVFEHPDFPWVGPDVDYSREWKDEEVFDNFVLEPYGPPGYAQHYSSTNYLLLTAIIEEVTGSTVPNEIERHFLDPMKLDNTFVSMGNAPPAKYTVAHPWVDTDLDGKLDDLYGIHLTWKATLTHPVMFSTASDLANWIHALYYEKNVISSNSLDEMLTFPEISVNDPEGGKYGLGVVDYIDLLGVRSIGHGGSSLGYSAAALYLPDHEITVVWLINTGESPPALAGQLMGQAWSSISNVLITNQK